MSRPPSPAQCPCGAYKAGYEQVRITHNGKAKTIAGHIDHDRRTYITHRLPWHYVHKYHGYAIQDDIIKAIEGKVDHVEIHEYRITKWYKLRRSLTRWKRVRRITLRISDGQQRFLNEWTLGAGKEITGPRIDEEE